MLEYRDRIPLLVGMFQKEVAVRIAAPHGNKDYGILSVLTQIYYDAEVAFHIPPCAFQPPPKVMSSVLVLKRKLQPENVDFKLLSRIVKAAFNQRRKMLRNALSDIFTKEILGETLFEKRAEELPVATFVELSDRLGKLNQGDSSK
jgi:16S rRNA (adenine1518-N6/adenine1519-N6)-dimethyltransferase